jgi:AcrR family transcriptional regulator
VGNARTRILQAALELLVENPHATRMEDVARRAKVSRQAVYLHFADRTALLVAVARHGDESLGLDEATRPVREATDGLSSLDRLAEFLGDYLPKVNELSLLIESMALSDPAAKAAVSDRNQERRGGCQMIVGRLKADGVLARGLSLDDAVAVLMGLTSIGCWRDLMGSGLSKQSFVKQMKRMFRLTLTRP